MRTIAILPVKRFGAAKQRLAGALAGGSRQALAEAMFADVLATLRRVEALDAIAVVTGDARAEAMARSFGVTVLHDQEEAGQSAAAAIGVRHALDEGFERALLAPGDVPMLDDAELSSLLLRAEEYELAAVIVPDRHGAGTNALLLRPPDAVEPSFGPGSRERHLQAAHAARLRCSLESLPSLALDVDTPEDLAELRERLADSRGHASVTRGAIRQLGRLQARVSA